jgi:hypothetical protein
MEILIIIGYVIIATTSVFGIINMLKQIKNIPNEKD